MWRSFGNRKDLLIHRRDNGLWALPGGGADVGETLAEAAIREFLEKTGSDVRLVRLLAVLDSRLWQSNTRFHLYHHMFLGELEKGAKFLLDPTGDGPTADTLAAAFFVENELPELHAGHTQWVPLAFRHYQGELPVPFLDGLA